MVKKKIDLTANQEKDKAEKEAENDNRVDAEKLRQ